MNLILIYFHIARSQTVLYCHHPLFVGYCTFLGLSYQFIRLLTRRTFNRVFTLGYLMHKALFVCLDEPTHAFLMLLYATCTLAHCGQLFALAQQTCH